MLPVIRAAELPVCPPEHRWLIEGLWADEAVGIVGGEPKCGKSFLALDMVVAVAGGVPCLRRFPSARLADDRQQLQVTIAVVRPILLVLDPFVRLHRIDENAASEVAPLLAYLRELQRRFALAVVVVHHARKGAHAVRAGQALRGSSEFHAWGDSNLYLRRSDDRLLLSIEHRAAPSSNGLPLALSTGDDALALHIVDAPRPMPPSAPSPMQTLEQVLGHADRPLTLAELRQACHLRTARVCQALATLTAQGRVQKTAAGYQIAAPGGVAGDPFPDAPLHRPGNGNG